MRNGLNIAGVSEIVHEIREVPREAVIIFTTTTRAYGPGADTAVGTAHHGSYRMARDFRMRFGPLPGDELSPWEAAVAAFGACVLVTHMHGYTARGISVAALRVRISATVGGDAPGLRDVRYEIDVDAAGSSEMLAAVTQFVTCFSPNHRALLDEGSADLDHVRDGAAVAVEQRAPIASPELRVSADLVWEYGTEATVTTSATPGGDDRAPTFIVDQSKQMLGIDRGPNPQEWLLAALSAELTLSLRALAAERGIDAAGVEVDARGQLDIRGMLNVSPDIPARFHNLRFAIISESDVDELVAEAVARSQVLATLRVANSAQVVLRSASETLLDIRSDHEQVTAFLAEIARQQAAQAASNALVSE
ncbi:OsmC family protein [Actinokineospora sp. 24-640]